MIATLAACAAAADGADPDEISFTAVLSIIRAGISRRHLLRALRPDDPKNPLGRLITCIIAHPRNRTRRTPDLRPHGS